MAEDRKTSNRGFASMDEDKQREIAKKGGESVPDEKRSFSRDHELASEAGRKGEQSVRVGEPLKAGYCMALNDRSPAQPRKHPSASKAQIRVHCSSLG
jgi:general stress protein YciG